MGGEMSLLRLLALFGFTVLAALVGPSAGQQTIKLGFLTPYPEADSAIPVRLADEWISALRIALEVLAQDNGNLFTVQPYVQNSNCNREAGAEAAKRLVRTGVVGIVGPACSEAAAGAAEYLATAQSSIPLISFAATATELGNREKYPTFFRTVFPDKQQARAIMNVTEFFNWTKVYMLYSEEAYGRGIQQDIMDQTVVYNVERTTSLSKLAPLDVISIGVPVDTPADGYGEYFSSIVPDAKVPVIFATTPKVAQKLWEEAFNKDKLNYPWWYFGTDGATAFDLIGEGETYRALAYNLQGEIGMHPYRGNYANNSPYLRFLQAWSDQPYSSFPGLLTFPRYPRFEEPRAYVPHLIDAVWAFHWAFFTLVNQQRQVSSDNVMEVLQSPDFVFEGCTGTVAFQGAERDTSRENAEYNFVSLQGTTWVNLGQWKTAFEPPLFMSTDKIHRPGKANESAPAPTSSITTENGTTVTETAGPANVSSQALAPDVAAMETSPQPEAFTGNATYLPDPSQLGPTGSPSGSTYIKSSGASTGLIVGIVVPLVLVVIILGVGVFFYIRRRQQESSEFVRVLF